MTVFNTVTSSYELKLHELLPHKGPSFSSEELLDLIESCSRVLAIDEQERIPVESIGKRQLILSLCKEELLLRLRFDNKL